MFHLAHAHPLLILYYRIFPSLNNTTKIAEVSIANPSSSTTSSNKLLAYRPWFKELHNSNLAAILLNAKELTCGSTLCMIVGADEDGFNNGQVLIGAGDGGNNFQVFNSTKDIPTYGVAIKGCSEINQSCLPNSFEITIACYVPCDCI